MPPKNVQPTDGNHDEKQLLARFIQYEGTGQSLECCLGIGFVIMNRVRSNAFPNSIKEVINQPKMFASIAQVNKVKEISKEAAQAAEMAVADQHGPLGEFPPNIFYFGKLAEFEKVPGYKKAIFRQYGEIYFFTDKLYAK